MSSSSPTEQTERLNGTLRDSVIKLHSSGALVRAIFGNNELPVLEDDFAEKCIGWHNAGEIDLIASVDRLTLLEIPASSFFSGQNFYCAVIPDLSSPIDAMMRAVDALVEKGGNDLAANRPNAAFQEWCSKDISRATYVLNKSRGGDELASRHLAFALQSHNLADEAMEMARAYEDNRRLAAIAALARMEYSDKDVARSALGALTALLGGETDDRLRSHILGAVIDIIDKYNLPSSEIVQAVDDICSQAGPETQFASARCLAFSKSANDPDLLNRLLGILKPVSPEFKATLENLDVALSKLTSSGLGDVVVAFLREFLLLSDGQVELSEFDSFRYEIVSNNRPLLQRLLLTWLASGEEILCESLTVFFRAEDGHTLLGGFSMKHAGMDANQFLFFARKTIGYLFLYPKVVAAVLVGAVRDCPEQTRANVAALLFDPLLINYGGAAKEYLETVPQSDGAFSEVQAALASAQDYLHGLQSVGTIKELCPSASERQVAREKQREFAREVQKQAEEHSVFLSLVHRSTLLYGCRSLSYYSRPGEKPQPSEMKLQSHSVSFEMPRSEVIDPYGLDYMLRVFRVERFKT